MPARLLVPGLGEIAEKISADAGEFAGIEAAYDELPGVFAASLAFVPLGAAFADDGGEMFGAEWVDGPAGVWVEDFTEAAELAADDRQAAGHGFGDDVGDAVAVAVGSDDAGHAEAAGLLDVRADGIGRQDAGPGDETVEVKVVGLGPQLIFQWAGTDDGQADVAVLLFEKTDGVEEYGNALFGDEAADEEQADGGLDMSFGLEGPNVEKDTMIEEI